VASGYFRQVGSAVLRRASAKLAPASADGEGDWHVAVIEQLVCGIPDCRYLEVGVRWATCWNRVAPLAAWAEGIDIDPAVKEHVKTEVPVQIMSSDDYFRLNRSKTFDVIFLDGDHSFEQISKDFENALRLLSREGTVVLHDTWPMKVEETGPLACGTVYKLAMQVEADPSYNVFTFRRFPGVTLVQRARPDRFDA
jgi:hypothetical protein